MHCAYFYKVTLDFRKCFCYIKKGADLQCVNESSAFLEISQKDKISIRCNMLKRTKLEIT